VPDILDDAVQNVTFTTGMSRAEFLAVWANHTAEADKVWEGLLVSANSTSGSSGIAAASAQALFNASVPASLLDASWNGTQLWRRATQGDLAARDTLGANFTLTARQVDMVCSWLSTSFYQHYTMPNVTSLCTAPWWRGFSFMLLSRLTTRCVARGAQGASSPSLIWPTCSGAWGSSRSSP
jgi:hypothetical protein